MATKRQSLAEIFESIEASKDPELELLELIIERARQTDEALAEAIRFCALPRRFDAEIIGVLRGQPDESVVNEQLLAALRAYNFVLERKAGGFVYHDNTRDLLLKNWRGNETKRVDFDEYNVRLADYYSAQHEQAQRAERDLGRVEHIVHDANPARYIQLSSIVESRVVTPLLEALYHQALRSAKKAFDFFVRHYHNYEARGRLTVCRSLIDATRDVFRRLWPEQASEHLLWLQYYEARLFNRLRQYKEAETILNDLLPHTSDQLKQWTLGDLGVVLQQQFKLRRAREVFEAELALAIETRSDPYNLPISYSRVANLHWTLDELEQAAQKYRESIDAAERENNPRLKAYGFLDLSGVLQMRGDWESAFGTALEALHLARTELADDGALQQAVGQRFLYIFARHDARMLDTLFAESLKLLSALGDPTQALDLRSRYVGVLRESGRVTQAAAEFEQLIERAAAYADSTLGTELLITQSFLFDDQGRLDESGELYAQVIERASSGRANSWHLATALSDRGIIHTRRARFTAAYSDLEAAIEQWEAMGYEHLAALMRIQISDCLRTEMELERAQSVARHNATDLIATALQHEAQGDVHRLQGQWDDARANYEEALRIYRSINLLMPQPQNLFNLTALDAAQSRWSDAALHSAEVVACWQQSAQLPADAYIASTPRLSSDTSALPGASRKRFEQAQALLDRAYAALRSDYSSHLADYHQVQGNVFRDQQRWQDARLHYQDALTINLSLGLQRQAVSALNELALLAAREGRWPEATQHSTTAAELWRQLADFEQYTATDTSQHYDQLNAAARQRLAQTAQPTREELAQARDVFHAARENIPDNLWYAINLMYVQAELSEWADAALTLQALLEEGPAWIRSAVLYRRLAEYRLKEGELLVSAGHFSEASLVYADSSRWLHGREPLRQLSKAWLELGDHLLKLDRVVEAYREYQAGLVQAATTDDQQMQADFLGRLSYLAVAHPRIAALDAHTHIAQALDLYRAAGASEPGDLLADATRSLLESVEDYWRVDAAWRVLIDGADVAQSLREDLSTARRALMRYLDDSYQLAAHFASSENYLPVVTPIAVEFEASLLPPDPDHDWPFLSVYLPDLRERIQREMGVPLPGVRVRSNESDMPLHSYLIMLDEIPIVIGVVYPDMCYSPNPPEMLRAHGIPDEALKSAAHPLTGDAGCWVAQKYRAQIEQLGLMLWVDPLLYVISHLEAILRRNLDEYLGLQELRALLTQWEQTERGATLIASALPDAAARSRCARVLRGLLRERVSIVAWDRILEVISDIGLPHDDVSAAIRATRLSLKPYLPGNDPNTQRIELPQSLEDKLGGCLQLENGKTFLAILPEDTQDFLAEIRDLVNVQGTRQVLVTHSAELRPFVRRVVELEFPDLMVLSQEETLSKEEWQPLEGDSSHVA